MRQVTVGLNSVGGKKVREAVFDDALCIFVAYRFILAVFPDSTEDIPAVREASNQGEDVREGCDDVTTRIVCKANVYIDLRTSESIMNEHES